MRTEEFKVRMDLCTRRIEAEAENYARQAVLFGSAGDGFAESHEALRRVVEMLPTKDVGGLQMQLKDWEDEAGKMTRERLVYGIALRILRQHFPD